MKKWENPEIQTLILKGTETLGPIEVSCTECGRTKDAIPVICWQCPCCKKVYHSKDSSQEASDNARALANACEEKDIASGQCS